MTRILVCAAIVALTLSTGCKREESRTTTAPSPPAAPQPPEKAPSPPAAPGSATAPGEPSRTAGQTLDDAGITAKVKAAFIASSDVKALEINVDTLNGKVTLKGSVDSQTQIDRAVQIARDTQGVKDIDSQLTVKPAK